MKLLFTSSYYLPYVSGITIHMQRLAEHFAKNNDVTILTSQFEKDLLRRQNNHRITIIRVPFLFKLYKGIFMPTFFWNAILQIRRADVIVINAPEVEGLFVALIAALFRKKTICIYHCEVTLPKNYFTKLLSTLLLINHLIIFILVEKIVTYTKDYANHSRILPHFEYKVKFIPPPIPMPHNNRLLKKKLQRQIPSDGIYIGVAARISAEKGIEYLIEALPQIKLKIHKSIYLLIAGPKEPIGEKLYFEKITKLLRKNQGEIFILDTIPSSDLGSFYSLLDVLVLPSINATEAFGMVQVEAMLCGIPVVASNLPGVRVPIQLTGMGEICKIGNVNDLANKIILVLENRKKYVKKEEEIRQFFSEEKSFTLFNCLFSQW